MYGYAEKKGKRQADTVIFMTAKGIRTTSVSPVAERIDHWSDMFRLQYVTVHFVRRLG